jgi:leucyl-tRNA synthetase
MNRGTNKDETERLALAAPKVHSYLEGRQIRKVVVVPERLVNIVCG